MEKPSLETSEIKENGNSLEFTSIDELCQSLESEKNKFSTAIICLTSGLKEEIDRSDMTGRMRIIATAICADNLIERGENPVIILTGGKVYGEERPTLSSVAECELEKYGFRKPLEVVKEEFSKDTIENKELTDKVLETLGFNNSEEKKVIVISNESHLKRVKKIFNGTPEYNVNIEFKSAEELMEGFKKGMLPNDRMEHNYGKWPAKFKSYRKVKRMARREEIYTWLLGTAFGNKAFKIAAHFSSFKVLLNKKF